MESRNSTLHQGLWVTFRPLKVSPSIPSTPPSQTDIQTHPSLLILYNFIARSLPLWETWSLQRGSGLAFGGVFLREWTSKASGVPPLRTLSEVPYRTSGVLRVILGFSLEGTLDRFFKEVSGPRSQLSPRHGLKLQNSASRLGPWHSAPPKAAGGAVPALKRRRMPTLQLWLQGLHGVQGLQPQATARVKGQMSETRVSCPAS